MAEDDLATIGTQAAPGEVAFDYVKDSDFRVVWADGIIGGVTPSRHIHFALFSERPAIPRRVVHKVDGNGVLGDPVPEKMISRNAIIREMSYDVIMSAETALNIGNWLISQVDQLRRETAS